MQNKIIISHRGNLHGTGIESENHPRSIEGAIAQGFHVEIDVRNVDGKLFLGHDKPEMQVGFDFLRDRSDWLWVHAKNSEAIPILAELELNFFFHDKDLHTLTSRGFIWSRPGHYIFCKKEILVLPERVDFTAINSHKLSKASNFYGVCTDFPLEFSRLFD